MQFLYPGFLWALTALAIPIIIHLFYFRRFKRVYFTNVKFLKEIKEETSNRNKLKNVLILLSRCLALTALVFAFAQPFLSTNNTIKQGANAVSIFVDNSYSMTAKKDEIPLLDFAKEKARSIINAYSEEDKFQVITHDFEGRHQRWISKEDALGYIDEIQSTPSVQSIDKVINKQQQLFESTVGNKISYLISDFQKSITNISSIKDTTVEINLLPLQTAQNKNLSIDSVWFDGPIPVVGQSNNLIVRLRNNSSDDAEQVKLSFKKDGQDKPIGVLSIPANATITDTVVVAIQKTGRQQGIVNITDYPVQFDDNYYVAFNVPDTIKALSINDALSNKYMDAMFKGVKFFDLKNQSNNQLQYQKFVEYDLIIVNELKSISSGLAAELSTYIRNNGNVLIFPSKNADLASYNSFLSLMGSHTFVKSNTSKREVVNINREEFVFNDVYLNNKNTNLKLPVTTFSFDKQQSTSLAEDRLLSFRDGTSYISKYKNEEGQLFVCASPLDITSSDLVLNAEVFVPMVYKMAISRVNQKAISYTIANRVNVQTDNKPKSGDIVYKIKGETEFIPAQTPQGKKLALQVNNNIKKAGFYDLMLANEIVDQFAFNYDRQESDLSMYSESELTNLISSNPKLKVISEAKQADISSTVSEKDKGIALWKWFLIGALLFLLVEAFLIRFFK
jgi:Aerotolerance regulator N-terminal